MHVISSPLEKMIIACKSTDSHAASQGTITLIAYVSKVVRKFIYEEGWKPLLKAIRSTRKGKSSMPIIPVHRYNIEYRRIHIIGRLIVTWAVRKAVKWPILSPFPSNNTTEIACLGADTVCLAAFITKIQYWLTSLRLCKVNMNTKQHTGKHSHPVIRVCFII